MCFCQKFPHTNVGGNTSVQNVERRSGYKVDDHLQKVFTEFLKLQIIEIDWDLEGFQLNICEGGEDCFPLMLVFSTENFLLFGITDNFTEVLIA